MNAEVRWRMQFSTEGGYVCRVDIRKLGYTGGLPIIPLIGSDNPVQVKEDDSTDLLTEIRKKTGYINVIEPKYGHLTEDEMEGDETEDLYPDYIFDRFVEVYYWKAASLDPLSEPSKADLRFTGFVQVKQISQDYGASPRRLQLPVISPLGLMGELSFSWARLYEREDYWNNIMRNVRFYDLFSSLRRIIQEACNVSEEASERYESGELLEDMGFISPIIIWQGNAPYVSDNTPWDLNVRSTIVAPIKTGEDFFNIETGAWDRLDFKTLEYFLKGLCNWLQWCAHDVPNNIAFTQVQSFKYKRNAMYGGAMEKEDEKDFFTVFQEASNNNKISILPPQKSITLQASGGELQEQIQNNEYYIVNSSVHEVRDGVDVYWEYVVYYQKYNDEQLSEISGLPPSDIYGELTQVVDGKWFWDIDFHYTSDEWYNQSPDTAVPIYGVYPVGKITYDGNVINDKLIWIIAHPSVNEYNIGKYGDHSRVFFTKVFAAFNCPRRVFGIKIKLGFAKPGKKYDIYNKEHVPFPFYLRVKYNGELIPGGEMLLHLESQREFYAYFAAVNNICNVDGCYSVDLCSTSWNPIYSPTPQTYPPFVYVQEFEIIDGRKKELNPYYYDCDNKYNGSDEIKNPYNKGIGTKSVDLSFNNWDNIWSNLSIDCGTYQNGGAIDNYYHKQYKMMFYPQTIIKVKVKENEDNAYLFPEKIYYTPFKGLVPQDDNTWTVIADSWTAGSDEHELTLAKVLFVMDKEEEVNDEIEGK